jgi:hypothetical protein
LPSTYGKFVEIDLILFNTIAIKNKINLINFMLKKDTLEILNKILEIINENKFMIIFLYTIIKYLFILYCLYCTYKVFSKK